MGLSIPGMFLTHTCTIRRITESKGNDYSPSYSSQDVYTGVPCSVQPDESEEGLKFLADYNKKRVRIYMPTSHNAGTISISNKDRVVVGSTVYEIVGDAIDYGMQGGYLKVFGVTV